MPRQEIENAFRAMRKGTSVRVEIVGMFYHGTLKEYMVEMPYMTSINNPAKSSCTSILSETVMSSNTLTILGHDQCRTKAMCAASF